MHCTPISLASLALALLAAPAFADERPNVLYVLTDDHAVQAISAYGSPLIETPNLDRIAREGVLFRNSFCENSICAPSRAAILTGLYSHRHGVRTNRDRLEPDRTTFPALFQAAGYQTALVGKWHLKADPAGFDHWAVLPGQGSYYNPELRSAEGSRRHEGYATDVVTDLALEWLREERDPEKPFLLLCQHKAPHRTWAPAPRHLELYADRELPEPETLFDDYAGRSALLRDNEMSIAEHFYWDYDLKVPDSGLPDPFDRHLKSPELRRMTPDQRAAWEAAYGPRNRAFLEAGLADEELVRWKYQRYVKDYLRCVAAVDESVGRLLDWLDEEGLAENTIVVYASDQGFYLGEHGWYDKRWMFEESLRMPLLVRWPERIEPGTVVEELVQNVDHAPTLLAAAGLEVPGAMQGRSLLPLADGRGADDWRDAIYYAYYEEGEHHVPRHDGIRTGRHKLMYFPGTGEWQLFDLAADPRELQSLHRDPAHAAELTRLRARFGELRAELGADPWPLPEGPVPRIEHEERDLEGWRVQVDRRLLDDDEELGAQALRALAAKLHDVALVMPAEPLAALREVPIFLDLDHPLAGMQYHPAEGWLRAHGYDPAMTKAVHVPDVERFLALLRSNDQPWVVLHELAHAYHDRVLDFDDERIRAAWQAAVDSGAYESVLHVRGHETRHYALTDPKEYFAELSECYLGTNDFYPFVRAELRGHDPGAFELLREIWSSD